MITQETLNLWLAQAPEDEHLEFKEARQQYDTTKLLRYCVALANEGGGYLVLGVSDQRPRHVVGTQAYLNRGDITARILSALRMRVDVQELLHPDGRVLVFAIPPRPAGTPLHHEGTYLMRAGVASLAWSRFHTPIRTNKPTNSPPAVITSVQLIWRAGDTAPTKATRPSPIVPLTSIVKRQSPTVGKVASAS